MRIALMTFIVPVPAELSPAVLIDSTSFPDPLFRQSIAERQCLDGCSGLWASQAIDLADARLRIDQQRGDHASASVPFFH
jgi:hypothetical protein